MQPRRCERCGTRKRLLKHQEGLPRLCYACWKAKDVPFTVTVLPAQRVPPPSMRITSKGERRQIAILKSASGNDWASKRKWKARDKGN